MNSADLPLLVFGEPNKLPREKKGGGGPKLHTPNREYQIDKFDCKFEELNEVMCSDSIEGYDPEMVLVIEIVGSVDNFRQAVEKVGLEWLGETDIDELDYLDDEFYRINKKGERGSHSLPGQMYLTASSRDSVKELLTLWNLWKENKDLPFGKGKWKTVFDQLVDLRPWGVKDTILNTGMLENWKNDISDKIVKDVSFQIEFFYRKSFEKRREIEHTVTKLLDELKGKKISEFIDISEIRFHAVKVSVPVSVISDLVDQLKTVNKVQIKLFTLPGVLSFRPTGQSLAISFDEQEQEMAFPKETSNEEPIAALLDGVPLARHEALKDRVLVDDIFDLEPKSQPGQRKHGTQMASLILHGDLCDQHAKPLKHKLYCVPIMQPDNRSMNCSEHIPEGEFLEDRIHIAVKRMLEGEGEVPAQAPSVKVINLSIGDPARAFDSTLSSWARLLDWLSFKYRVLFCVSAGNYINNIDLELSEKDFKSLSNDEKTIKTLGSIRDTLNSRGILSPGEAINVITVGAAHDDCAGDNYIMGDRIDILPSNVLLSPISRVGFGFHHSIKPDILFPGGRQLYRIPLPFEPCIYKINTTSASPGQKVASDTKEPGKTNGTIFSRGTSNATALATRTAVQIYDKLKTIRDLDGKVIPDNLISVLMKTLLVHGAKQNDDAQKSIEQAFELKNKPQKRKREIARLLGYGNVDVNWVLSCTDQRATVLGYGEIHEDETHEFELPIPLELSDKRLWRRLTITLAWFSPLNFAHRNVREGKLYFEPANGRWSEQTIELSRTDGDSKQVLKGTVQHEVLQGDNKIEAFFEDEKLKIQVICQKDATQKLDELIPYGLAVTLEVKEDIPIYQSIRSRIGIKSYVPVKISA